MFVCKHVFYLCEPYISSSENPSEICYPCSLFACCILQEKHPILILQEKHPILILQEKPFTLFGWLWLVMIFCERKTQLAGCWFDVREKHCWLIEANGVTISIQDKRSFFVIVNTWSGSSHRALWCKFADTDIAFPPPLFSHKFRFPWSLPEAEEPLSIISELVFIKQGIIFL